MSLTDVINGALGLFGVKLVPNTPALADTTRHFQLSAEQRRRGSELLARDSNQVQIMTSLLEQYEGVDGAALLVLTYAANQGRLGEFADRLQGDYESRSFKYCEPSRRYGHFKTTLTFEDYLRELGVGKEHWPNVFIGKFQI